MFMKETICMIAGVVGGVITTLLGGWDSALATLVVFMGIDFVTGIVTAAMGKSKHSESGRVGLAKKFCILLMVVVGVRIDILIGTNYIRDTVCISFCLNELLSIVENTTLMGIPYPPVIKKAIDVLQTKVGRAEEQLKESEDDKNGNSET